MEEFSALLRCEQNPVANLTFSQVGFAFRDDSAKHEKGNTLDRTYLCGGGNRTSGHKVVKKPDGVEALVTILSSYESRWCEYFLKKAFQRFWGVIQVFCAGRAI